MDRTFFILFAFLAYIVAIGIILHTKQDPLHILKEKNLRRGCALLLLTMIFAIYAGTIPALITYYSIIILNEIICFFSGIDFIYDNDSTVNLFYSIPDNCDANNEWWNKTEACYDYPGMSPQDANDHRYKKIISLLGLKPGDRLLDIGCGEGTFVAYCQSVGIHAAGFTLVKGQAERAQQRGLNIRQGSYHNFFKEFENQFDAVTFLGCLEHACPNGHRSSVSSKMNNFYPKIFQHAKRYLDKKSKIRKIYTTTLHANPSYEGTIPSFILARAYGGAYPWDKDGARIFDYAGGKVIYVADHTLDYFSATANDEKHFGHTRNGNWVSYLKALFFAPVYPLILYILAYDLYGIWMWQFTGKYHKKRDYVFQQDRKIRPTTLYWSVIQID